MGEAETPHTMAAGLLVMLMGCAMFTFGTLGARDRMPGSRVFQALGVFVIMVGVFFTFTGAE